MKKFIIELPAEEADLLAQHAAETGTSVSSWVRTACRQASYFVPLGIYPDPALISSDDDEHA